MSNSKDNIQSQNDQLVLPIIIYLNKTPKWSSDKWFSIVLSVRNIYSAMTHPP